MIGTKSEVLPCGEFAAIAGRQLCECSTTLADRARHRCCPSLEDLCLGIHLGACSEVFETLLLSVSALAFLLWLLLPSGMWESWLCGYGMLIASFLAFTAWRTSRELRMRYAFETSARQLSEENASLKASSAQLKGDLVMLQDTIGALGDQGADWLGQLRILCASTGVDQSCSGISTSPAALLTVPALLTQRFATCGAPAQTPPRSARTTSTCCCCAGTRA